MSPNRPESDWTREESRYVDGELDAEQAERLEARLQGAPEGAEHIEAWREAMDLWRDDTRRRAAHVDAGALARSVQRDLERAPSSGAADTTRRYAVAALVLLGIGLTGSLWLGARPARLGSGDVSDVIRAVESHRLDFEGTFAVHELCADLRADREEEDR